MATFDEQYEALVRRVAREGAAKPSRQAGARTRSLTGATIRVPIGERHDPEPASPAGWVEIRGFPALRCKRLALGQVFAELAWFLRGSTSAAELAARGCHIWDADARRAAARGLDLPAGELGPIYGYQWRRRPSGDQLAQAVAALAEDPFGRRNLVVSWNADDLPGMVLPPCHYAFQFVCEPAPGPDLAEDVRVHCVVTMRSTDVGLGLPFNVASYAMLTALACLEAEARGARRYAPGDVIVNMADCHVYESHLAPLQAAVAAAAGAPPRACTVRLPRGTRLDEFARWGAPRLSEFIKNAVRYAGPRPPAVPLELHT